MTNNENPDKVMLYEMHNKVKVIEFDNEVDKSKEYKLLYMMMNATEARTHLKSSSDGRIISLIKDPTINNELPKDDENEYCRRKPVIRGFSKQFSLRILY